MLRHMTHSDLDQVVPLYEQRMAHSTYAKLGEGFVREVLAGMIDCPHGRAVVDEEGGRIRGFITAATDVEALYRWLKRKRWTRLAPRAFGGVLRYPTALFELLETGSYFERAGLPGIRAELLHIAVQPDLVSEKISSGLLAAMLHALYEDGIRQLKVTTEAENEPPQKLLESFGFARKQDFRFYGKPMVIYLHKNLTEARREAF